MKHESPDRGSVQLRRSATLAAALLIAACAAIPDKPTARPAAPPQEAAPEAPAPKLITEPVIWNTAAQVNLACDEHLRAAGAIRASILAVSGKRGLANTLEPFNRLYIQIDRILPMSELIANVHPDKAVRNAAEICEQRAKKFLSILNLDRGLFDALKGVATDGLDREAARFVSHQLRDYRRAGVDRDQATREKLAALNEKMVKIGQLFRRNITEDRRTMLVTEKELAGLPLDYIAARKKPGQKKIKITTDYPDFIPVVSYARSEKLRRAIYKEYQRRAFPKNEEVLRQLLTARHAYATMLGYPDWPAYAAEDKMVKKKEVIADFIDKVSKLARPRMKKDLKAILARKRRDSRRAKFVGVWDRYYYVKKIQAEKFGVNAEEVRAYFDFKRVKAGILSLAQELFSVTFERVARPTVWHPGVEVYQILDGGKPIARFYLDLHPREGKYGHAAEFAMISGVEGVQLPAAALVTNFPDPGKSKEGLALTEHQQVKTFFHEFGHLMHQLLAGRKRWVSQSGITCEWDFVEAPSQLLEEWTWDPTILARFAKHHKTGKPISAALVKKMRSADEFGKGVHVMRQMFYAGLSFELHRKDPRKMNLHESLLEVQKKYSPYPWQKDTAVFANFGHLAGYSSMYYTYMWSLVLAKDLFTRFVSKGLMDPGTAREYRKKILEPGGSVDAAEMVKDFLGRPSSFDAYREWLLRN